MPNNYNSIAGFYDFLRRLVFQKAIINAQIFLLRYIPPNSDVLIVGGGTGWILEELARLEFKNIRIVYIEKSGKMINQSKKRNYKNISVEFLQAGIENCKLNKQFDVIFTAFLFDNFLPVKVEAVFNKLDDLLKQNGLWLFADFVNEAHGKLWKKILLKAMYLFFKLTCNIETQQLINMENFFTAGYTKTGESFYYSKFIRSVVYKKYV